MYFFTRVKQFLFGHPLNPLNPKTAQHVSLIAFFAWVGMGADGLSSSCYGPEEAYVALGVHNHFALYVAIATALTVFIISLGYNQVIELFPSGGGGYKVASQLLGPHIGLVSGAALIVDYALTIAISIASGMDAVFSMLPMHWHPYKLTAEAFAIGILLLLNMRGMKESIWLLMPIVLGFFIVHVAIIGYGIFAHHQGLSLIIPHTILDTKETAAALGVIPVIALVLHAYSLGSGTYTGIEAVSNNVNHLKEPRITTGKWTMLYMAVSLSVIAAGTILLYLLWDAEPQSGKTLNAVVFSAVLGDSDYGQAMLWVTLALEAGLLLVAANTGFLAGPSVLANMAIDGWMPNRFRHYSSRLVIQNGLFLFGAFAMGILIWCKGQVSLLVILYSINVFITFSLTLFGLCVYWVKHRQHALGYRLWRFSFSSLAFLIAAGILCVTTITKFQSGGWLTLVVTTSVVAVCLLIKQHYRLFDKKLHQLDIQLKQPIAYPLSSIAIDPKQSTAVIFVGKSQGVAMHTLLNVIRTFPDHFKNFVFIGAGSVDVSSFSGQEALKSMQEQVHDNLQYFVDYCHQYGMPAEYYSSFGIDVISELSTLSEKVSRKYPNCIFFSSKLIFKRDNFITRFLHHETALTLQRNLHLQGKELMILPVRL